MFELTLLTVLLWIVAIGVTLMLLPFIAALLIATSILAMGTAVTVFVGVLLFFRQVGEIIYRAYKTTVAWFKRTSGTRPS